MAKGVDFVGRIEVDAVDQIDDIAEQIPGDHAVLNAAKDVGDHVTPAIPILPLQCSKVGEQARPLRSSPAERPHRC